MSNKSAFSDNEELLKIKGTDKNLIKLSANTVKPVKVLCEHAGRLSTDDGEIRYVSVKDIKIALQNIDSLDNVWGFMIPVPKISGPIWNDRLDKLSGEICDDDLYELFDQEIEKSSVRSWYYEAGGKYILRTYMLPIRRYLKHIGKEIVFDLGSIEMQYDLMKNMIIPGLLKKAGLSVAVHKESGNVERELGFSDKDFVIDGDFLEKVEKANDAKILLVRPTRGMMERFIQGEIKGIKNRLETPALMLGIESVYYSDMLSGYGHSFDVADEIRLPKFSELRKYEHILICKSCLFTETETKRIDRLKRCGVKINDRDLICELSQKGEN